MIDDNPLNFILLVSVWDINRLECTVVLEISKRVSTSDLFPECLLPKIMTGVF